MYQHFAVGLILVLGLGATEYLTAAEPVASKGELLFALRVKPLLAQKCFACHGSQPDDLQGALDLTSRAAMLRGGESGAVVLKPGKPAASLLYTAAARISADYQMPPKENDALTEQQAKWLHDWIQAGAPWPGDDRLASIQNVSANELDAGVQVPTSGGLSDEWTQRRYAAADLWAYQPVRKPQAPVKIRATDGAHPIDAFIDKHLVDIGAPPAPRADRRMLLRRATFDLLGLPPSPLELDAFVHDPAPDEEAFAKVADRLLASPHYGEQWGRHWLDVARYADTAGLANDFERPNAWRYRDYVVRAFNDDKPYDQFIREQIAGDEIDPANPEMLIAVGLLRMGPWEQTGMSVARLTRQQFLDDVTDAVGQVFLAQPLQCCRCHDHKFDPIPTRDYYAFQAVFATTQFAERDAPFLPHENLGPIADDQGRLNQRIAHYEDELRRIAAKEEQAARQWYAERNLEYTPRNQLVKRGVPEEKIAPRHIGLTTEDFGLERVARKNLARHTWELDRYRPIAYSVYTGRTPTLSNVQSRLHMPSDPAKEGTWEATAILAGGDAFSATTPVTPGVLSCLATPRAEISEAPHGRRLALARWIADPRNPLTARVLVNRVWQHHFGQALAGNPNNFGATGKKPTHPELLDYLAATFVEQGWSIKKLHRLIMTSQAYQRSSQHPHMAAVSQKDPDKTAYAYFPMRRLSAEELRDAMLAASDELNRTVGGAPIRPDMNLEAALQPRQIMGTYAPAYQPSALPEQRNRRSIYAMRIRGLADPFLEVFNQPSSEKSCEIRDASTVATQAFALLNGEETYDRALAMAGSVLRENLNDRDAISLAFRRTLSREPTPEERDTCLAHWQRMTARHEQLEFLPQNSPKEVVRHAIEEMNGEPFTFIEKLEVYEDYVPDTKPWSVDSRTRGLAEVCLVLFNTNEFIYVP